VFRKIEHLQVEDECFHSEKILNSFLYCWQNLEASRKRTHTSSCVLHARVHVCFSLYNPVTINTNPYLHCDVTTPTTAAIIQPLRFSDCTAAAADSHAHTCMLSDDVI